MREAVILSVLAGLLLLAAILTVAKLVKGGTLHVAPTMRTESEEPVTQALPVNPDSPPTWRTFNPRPDRRPDLPLPTCACHDQPLEPGSRILWWPLPPDKQGRVGVRVFCSDAVEGMEKPS